MVTFIPCVERNIIVIFRGCSFPAHWHLPCSLKGCELNQKGGKEDENKNWSSDFSRNVFYDSHPYDSHGRAGWQDERPDFTN